MKRVELDFSQCYSKDAVHDYLIKKFDFPQYYGRNLDALFDVLGDVSEDMEIVFFEDEEGSCGEWVVDSDGIAQSDELVRYLKNVRRVIEDAAEENSCLHL